MVHGGEQLVKRAVAVVNYTNYPHIRWPILGLPSEDVMKSFRLAVFVAILSGLLGGVAAAAELPFGFSLAATGIVTPDGQQAGLHAGAFVAPADWKFELTVGRQGWTKDGLDTTVVGFETTYGHRLELIGRLEVGFGHAADFGAFVGLGLPFHTGSTDMVSIAFMAGKFSWQLPDEATGLINIKWSFSPQMVANWFR